MVDHLEKTGAMAPTAIIRSRTPYPQNSSRTLHEFPVKTDPKVQSQPEDGTYIGPKHVVVITLL